MFLYTVLECCHNINKCHKVLTASSETFTNQHNNTTATFNKRINTSNKWFLEIIDSIRSLFLVILEIDL